MFRFRSLSRTDSLDTSCLCGYRDDSGAPCFRNLLVLGIQGVQEKTLPVQMPPVYCVWSKEYYSRTGYTAPPLMCTRHHNRYFFLGIRKVYYHFVPQVSQTLSLHSKLYPAKERPNRTARRVNRRCSGRCYRSCSYSSKRNSKHSRCRC